jgi:hypothetical protein
MSRKILEKSALFGAIDCVCCCLVRGFHWLFIGRTCERRDPRRAYSDFERLLQDTWFETRSEIGSRRMPRYLIGSILRRERLRQSRCGTARYGGPFSNCSTRRGGHHRSGCLASQLLRIGAGDDRGALPSAVSYRTTCPIAGNGK